MTLINCEESHQSFAGRFDFAEVGILSVDQFLGFEDMFDMFPLHDVSCLSDV